jgi:predicted ATP-grasp superfamily ATP-dependent carboligase
MSRELEDVRLNAPSLAASPADYRAHVRSADDPAGAIPGVVVVGGDFLGLGIVRSLGRKGIPVCVVDDERSIARYSRFTTIDVRVPNLRDWDQAVAALLEVGVRHRLEGWVLYPTRDETVAAIAARRTELARTFRLTTPSWGVVRWAWDKRNTYRLASMLDIPTPRTWYPSSPADLSEIDGDGPFVIKPAIKEHFFYATRVKAWRANDRRQLRELFAKATAIAGEGEIMIQELIPGTGTQQYAYCAFFKDGAALGSMVVRRRRQHPPEFGRASTYVETLESPELETMSIRLLREIDFHGLVEVEYKLDPRDGRFKLLDINARAWGYHSLGYAAGVDFPYLVYADQLGETLPALRGDAGIHWVRLLTDAPTAVVELLGGTLSWQSYLASLGRARVEAVFSLKDPVPWLAELALTPYLMIKRRF